MLGNSLVVQWLGLYHSTAGITGLILVGELRLHMPHSAAKIYIYMYKQVLNHFLLGETQNSLPAHLW